MHAIKNVVSSWLDHSNSDRFALTRDQVVFGVVMAAFAVTLIFC